MVFGRKDYSLTVFSSESCGVRSEQSLGVTRAGLGGSHGTGLCAVSAAL